MEYKITQIKPGIKFHEINTNKFKTNLMAVFLTTKLERENVTKNALISMLLRRGSKSMKTQEEINKEMEELFGRETTIQSYKFIITSQKAHLMPTFGRHLKTNKNSSAKL